MRSNEKMVDIEDVTVSIFPRLGLQIFGVESQRIPPLKQP
jgi:hypothetical protein